MIEIIRFLCYKDLYNIYSKYSLKDLVAPEPVLRAVYRVIRELHEGPGGEDKEISVDELALLARDKVRDGEVADLGQFINSLRQVDRSKYSPEGIKRAFENAYKRSIARFLATSAIPVLNGGAELDIPDLLKVLEEGNNVVAATDNLIDYTTYSETKYTPAKTIPTYIKPLDDAIEGGLSPGQLASFVGWPGIGKTLLLHQAGAMAYFHGYHAAIVTLEISKEDACRRLDMLFGRWKSPDKYNDLKQKAKENGGKLTILDATDDIFTPGSVRAFLEGQRRRGRAIDVLFIDYADLMDSGRNLEDYNELGEIYRQLRRLANKFAIPIWTASQAVRGAFNKRWIGMGDIADSFKKARIADVIITINQTEEEQETGDIRLYVAKSRRNKGHPKLYLGTDMDRMAVVPKKEG